MGIFGKKKEDEVKQEETAAEKTVKKTEKPAKKDSAEKKIEKKSDKKTEKYVSIAAAHDVIVAPIITEKTHGLATNGKYTFRVAKPVTKQQVKSVVEEMYKVTVENVNIVVVKPKRRTVKYDRGYQSLYKKAIVTVKEGDHITMFEGA